MSSLSLPLPGLAGNAAQGSAYIQHPPAWQELRGITTGLSCDPLPLHTGSNIRGPGKGASPIQIAQLGGIFDSFFFSFSLFFLNLPNFIYLFLIL
jgi:hypothetical protein